MGVGIDEGLPVKVEKELGEALGEALETTLVLGLESKISVTKALEA